MNDMLRIDVGRLQVAKTLTAACFSRIRAGRCAPKKNIESFRFVSAWYPEILEMPL